jgi:hypothetical protein
MYNESKKAMDKIRRTYGCRGEVLFRTALQYVVECGQHTIKDKEWLKEQMDEIDARHDKVEGQGRILIVSRDFEKAIIKCAAEIAEIPTYDLMVYIQREVYLTADGIDYQRSIELLKNALEYIEWNSDCDDEKIHEAFENIGFEDDEIKELGFGYLLENDEEEE